MRAGRISRTSRTNRERHPNRANRLLAKAAPVRRDGGLRAGCAEGALRQGAFFCPIDSKCGGCEWLAVPYAEQPKAQAARSRGLSDGLLDPETAVRLILAWTTRVTIAIRSCRPIVGYMGQKSTSNSFCGMYERGTHRVIDSDECLLENREAKRIILRFATSCAVSALNLTTKTPRRGFLRMQVRIGHTSGEIMVTVVTREDHPLAKGVARCARATVHHDGRRNVNTRQTNVILAIRNARCLVRASFSILCGLSFRISSKSFYQVNSMQTEVLYRRAIEMAKPYGRRGALWTRTAARARLDRWLRAASMVTRAARVIGVEERPDAVADARNNARHNGIKRAEFVAGRRGRIHAPHGRRGGRRSTCS